MKHTRDEIIEDQCNRIEELCENLKPEARKRMKSVLESGAVDLESIDIDSAGAIYPKLVLTLYLRGEPYSLAKDSKWNKEIKNLKHFV